MSSVAITHAKNVTNPAAIMTTRIGRGAASLSN